MLDHKRKFIFIHIPKTGGQTIERNILKSYNLTWEDRHQFCMGYNRQKNAKDFECPKVLAHLTAKGYYDYGFISKKRFNEYFKFSFTRNPWRRVVSFYYYLNYNERISFNDFVFKVLKIKENQHLRYFFRPQKDFISIDGEIVVDYVGKLETFQTDIKNIAKLIGISIETGKKNRSVPNSLNWKSLYDSQTIDMVAEIYKDDIQLFKYDFND